jgi:hypothetical protein
MSTNKIFCLGDGYAHGNIWPEWPQILQALLPDLDVVTGTGVGAGNEFLIDTLLNFDCENQTVIFQWAQPNRFDKLLQDTQWKILAQQDPVYFDNFEHNTSGIWWLSSNSQTPKIQEYHEFFVQSEQEQLRLKNQKILIENYLQNKKCRYWFTSIKQQEEFCRSHQHKDLRGDQIQPSTIMHFYFVVECIKPALNLPINDELQQALLEKISQTQWKAFDPDRKYIWQEICHEIRSKYKTIMNK